MSASKPDERILIIAPVGQDAAVMESLLKERGFQAEICQRVAEASRRIITGAGMLLMTEEALTLPQAPDLLETLRVQPPWSELPVVVLTTGVATRLLSLFDLAAKAAGGLTLLERPLATATLVRSIEVALRARRRQYQMRDLLESKARLAAIVETSEDAIISKDLKGIITSWNRGAERLFGYTSQEVVGQPVTILIPPDHLNEEPEILERIRRAEPIEHYETIRRRKDGVLLDISLTVSPIPDASGRIVGASKIARDITARKRTEALIASQKEVFELAALGAPLMQVLEVLAQAVEDQSQQQAMIAIHLLDKTGSRFEQVVAPSLPAAYTEITSGKEVSAVAVPCSLAIAQRQRVAVGDFAASQEFLAFATFAVPQGIRSGWSMPIFSSTGSVMGTFASYFQETHHAFSQDDLLGEIVTRTASVIIERRRGEEALAEAQAHLKQYAANLEKIVAERTQDLRTTNEQLEAFVYSIAHDLRTPLRAMIGYSQLLMDDFAPALEPAAQHSLKRIQASSEFMDKLLLDLLAYGRTARAEMPLEAVDVQKAWETALFQCNALIEQTHADVEIVPPLPAVLAHEATLGQVLGNLLNNALKFVVPGVPPKVRLQSEARGKTVCLSIEDNGIGIPPEQHERVFRIFERLNGSRYVGTGIGLSIVRKGIERMGGRVGLESEPGRGSRFWIELPKAN